MTRSMAEYQYGLALRDTIQRMVREEIDAVRPRYRYGTVTGINRGTMKCSVQLNGEEGSVLVNMGQAIQPNAVGQVVRVEGIGTDKFITDVIGSLYHNFGTGTVSTLYTAGPAMVTWTGDTVASGPYETLPGLEPEPGQSVMAVQIPGIGIRLMPLGLELVGKPKWITPTMQNGWYDYARPPFNTNVNATNNLYAKVQFTKTASGIVKVKGMMKNDGALPAFGTTIFTLPEGFRPAGKRIFQCRHNGGAGTLEVRADGNVTIRTVSAGWTSLDHITFPSTDVAPEDEWIVPTLVNSWEHYGTTKDGTGTGNNGWPYLAYWVDDVTGILWRRGLAKRATIPTTSVSGSSGVYSHVAPLNEPTNKLIEYYAVANYSSTAATAETNPGIGIVWSANQAYWRAPTAFQWWSMDGMPSPLNAGPFAQSQRFTQFGTSIAVYDSTTFNPLWVSRTRDRYVQLGGLLKSTAAISSGHLITILPPGYRPKERLLFTAAAAADTANAGSSCRIDVTMDGEVYYMGGGLATQWFSLGGINFIADGAD